MVSVTAVIGKDQTTVIDLNNEMKLQSSGTSKERVRLPNGNAIGNRAH
jgi:hypothetical protein